MRLVDMTRLDKGALFLFSFPRKTSKSMRGQEFSASPCWSCLSNVPK